MIYAVIRVRGRPTIRHEIQKTMKLMRLHKVNHMVLVKNTPSMRGMIQKAKDYITWGEIDKETLADVLKARGRLVGNKPLDEKAISKITDGKANSFEELAEMIINEVIDIKTIKDLKPVFRLHPPRKGYKGIKIPYRMGGALGYRGKDINDLIRRMI